MFLPTLIVHSSVHLPRYFFRIECRFVTYISVCFKVDTIDCIVNVTLLNQEKHLKTLIELTNQLTCTNLGTIET